MKNKIQASISLDTVKGLTLEVITEGAYPYAQLWEKVQKAKPGSKLHQELLCDLWTMASVIEAKAREAGLVIDEYLESLTDEDE